jgi:uncharacterized protein YjbI with pentapeptide repeats
MRIVQALLSTFVALLLWVAAPSVAQAASSSVIRAFDDAVVTTTDYSGQNLTQAEFANARLVGANFSRANLQGAVFNSASLAKANLRGADFSNGIAYITDFSGADLSNAILTEAMLLKSTFKDAKIEGADFSYASISREQKLQLCAIASGVNPVTGVSTRESLECP